MASVFYRAMQCLERFGVFICKVLVCFHLGRSIYQSPFKVRGMLITVALEQIYEQSKTILLVSWNKAVANQDTSKKNLKC